MTKQCKIARNVEVNGKKFKVVDPKDACAAVNKVLAKHEGSTILTEQQYEDLIANRIG